MKIKRGPITLGKMVRWFALFMIVIWVVAPFVPLWLWSFSLRWRFPALLPEAWSTRAWLYLLKPSSGVLDATIDSLVIAVVVTVVSVAIAIPAGRALGLYRFRGKRVMEFLILAPTIITGLASVFGVHGLLLRYHLANSLLGVMLVHLISSVT